MLYNEPSTIGDPMPMYLLVIILCAISFFAGSIATLAFAAYIDAQEALARTKKEAPTTSTFMPDILFYDQK